MKTEVQGKNVLVVGLGQTGVAVSKFLVARGAKVTITDAKQRADVESSIAELGDLPVELDLGAHNSKTFLSAELIVVSPGVPLNLKVLDEARERGTPITNEIELAIQNIDTPVIAVTGTNGKTTVATLIGEMIRAGGKTPFVCGNIGLPLITYINENVTADYIVLEISSFQLEVTESLRPKVSVFTNIAEDHLDRYGWMESYIRAKRRLLNMSGQDSVVVLNKSCPIVSEFAAEAKGRVEWFVLGQPSDFGGQFQEQFRGAYFVPGQTQITFKQSGQEDVLDLSKLKIFGDHNKENVMAAGLAVRAVGIPVAAMQTVVQDFAGVAHRLELVRRKDGVYFFNDSKATTPTSVRRSLESFKKSPVILIAGGKDKGLDFMPLQELLRRKCKVLILLGEAKEKINRSLGDCAETYLVGTFEEAVLVAFQKSRSGDVILLSPGCASYDMFKNFEERGDYFRKLVYQL